MSIVAAVKKAVEEGSECWGLNLPDTCTGSQKVSMQTAYYRGYAEFYRENRSEIEDLYVMRSAASILKKTGIRICF